MGNSAPRDVRRQKRVEQYRKLLEMRATGASWEQVARAYGYSSRAAAYNAAKNALKEVIREPAKAYVEVELLRLDVLLLAVWQKAKSGDVQAIDRVLRIMERRACYCGLDMPKRSRVDVAAEVVTRDGAREELLARIAQLSAAVAR